MQRTISIVLLVMLITGCIPESELPANLYAPQPGDAGLASSPIYIDRKELSFTNNIPPRFLLTVYGSYPTSCNTLRITVSLVESTNSIMVKAYSLLNKETGCIQVTIPFSATIDLGQIPSGRFKVWLNDEMIGSLWEPNVENPSSMRGWDLYCWQEDNHYLFALLPWTNRLLPDRVLLPEKSLASINEVKSALERLSKGEVVTLRRHNSEGGVLPPLSVRDDLTTWCQQHGLWFSINMN